MAEPASEKMALFPESQAHNVMMALAHGQGDEGFSEPELSRVLSEIHRLKLAGGIADLVLTGQMLVRIEGGEITYQTRPDAEVLKKP